MRPHNERLRAAAAIRPGERVLDIGCGAGQTSLEAARAGGHVLGVDVSEQMLDRARQRAEGSAEFVLADAQTHPFERGELRRRDQPLRPDVLRRPRGRVRESSGARCGPAADSWA